jgi:hypothetical protein
LIFIWKKIVIFHPKIGKILVIFFIVYIRLVLHQNFPYQKFGGEKKKKKPHGCDDLIFLYFLYVTFLAFFTFALVSTWVGCNQLNE